MESEEATGRRMGKRAGGGGRVRATEIKGKKSLQGKQAVADTADFEAAELSAATLFGGNAPKEVISRCKVL